METSDKKPEELETDLKGVTDLKIPLISLDESQTLKNPQTNNETEIEKIEQAEDEKETRHENAENEDRKSGDSEETRERKLTPNQPWRDILLNKNPDKNSSTEGSDVEKRVTRFQLSSDYDSSDGKSHVGHSSKGKSALDVVRAVETLKYRAKKRRDEEEMAMERENREKYLRNADNLKRAHEMMKETFMDLLIEKVDKDREEIQARSAQWEERLKREELIRQQERQSRKPKKTRVEVTHDKEYLDNVPKSRIYQVLQLKEEWKKEGKIKNNSDEEKFWERIKSGQNPVDEEINQKIRNRKLETKSTEVVVNQEAVDAEESQASEEKPNLLLRLMEGRKKVVEKDSKPEEISNQLPNLLNIPQFTKRRKSATPKPETPDPVLDLFKRPEIPKFKSLETDFDGFWSKEQLAVDEEEQRALRERERLKQKKKTQVMYQNALTHMAFTNRLMSRGFQELTLGSSVRDLVQQEQMEAIDIKLPSSPAPKLEPVTHTYAHSHARLIPLETRSDARPYKDKQYDKPSSSKSVDRRRVKKTAGTSAGPSSLEPFRGEPESTALSLQAIMPTSVVKQPRWHRSMWTNYTNIGVSNPDQQSQKWHQHTSNLGRELASTNELMPNYLLVSASE